MSTFQGCVVVVGAALAAKMWIDLIHFAYHRERVRAYTRLAREGTGLIRLAIERGVLSECVDAAARTAVARYPDVDGRPPTR